MNLESTPLGGQVDRIAFTRVSKHFGRVRVLSDVSLQIAPGEIHGLVGQNGSGKSTLIKLLSGVHRPDRGAELRIDGAAATLPITPRFLLHHGLSFVQQHLGLELNSTVTENVRIGRFRTRRLTRRVDWSAEAEAVMETLARLGQEHVDPFAIVGRLSHSDRTTVAIARALQSIDPGRGCIVFDETTQSLPRGILDSFYDRTRSLAASGTSVVIVSHRIPEILSLCDRVSVLDTGFQTAAGVAVSSLDAASLTTLITGHSRREMVRSTRTAAQISGAATVLDARALTGPSVDGISLSVSEGEVLGVTGGPDSGADDVPALLSGADPHAGGTLSVGGATIDLARGTPRSLARAGLAYVPADRMRDGVALSLSATDNVSLPRFAKRGRPWFIGRTWMDVEFASGVDLLGITPANAQLPASAFSGGNQQKLLLAKWLLNRPRVLVMHEPVQAVDVGAREDILSAIQDIADRGSGVVISSTEPEDLARICTRVVVLRDGQLHSELSGDEISAAAIIAAIYHNSSKELTP